MNANRSRWPCAVILAHSPRRVCVANRLYAIGEHMVTQSSFSHRHDLSPSRQSELYRKGTSRKCSQPGGAPRTYRVLFIPLFITPLVYKNPFLGVMFDEDHDSRVPEPEKLTLIHRTDQTSLSHHLGRPFITGHCPCGRATPAAAVAVAWVSLSSTGDALVACRQVRRDKAYKARPGPAEERT